MKEKYYIVLYSKITGDFVREYPVKNQNIAESQMAFYNDVTSNIRAEIKVVEVKR